MPAIASQKSHRYLASHLSEIAASLSTLQTSNMTSRPGTGSTVGPEVGLSKIYKRTSTLLGFVL